MTKQILDKSDVAARTGRHVKTMNIPLPLLRSVPALLR